MHNVEYLSYFKHVSLCCELVLDMQPICMITAMRVAQLKDGAMAKGLTPVVVNVGPELWHAAVGSQPLLHLEHRLVEPELCDMQQDGHCSI